MKHRFLPPFLGAIALATVLMLPGAASAQDATPASRTSTTECVESETDGSCLLVAPESERIDLTEPIFSDPTTITNPLFPISDQTHVIQLGIDAGESLRVEVTLLPEPKTISWNNQEVDTLASQFVAYVDGRIVEVATDYFAQADDGSVWYFGEDVFNYEDGVVVNTDGTWLAGVDGLPGMIMPGDPQVGDVYRPENIPGFVFEEVTVMAIDQTVEGPVGPVEGAIVIQELLMDGTQEEKVFAPGYGEFSAETDTEFIVVALALPVDDQPGEVPAELQILSTGAAEVFAGIPEGDWGAVSDTMTTLTAAWDALRPSDLPPVLGTQMSDALDTLVVAVGDEDSEDALQAAIDVGRASLDLQLQYRSLNEVDIARLRLSTDQILVDAAADDTGAVAGDVVVMETIWDRVAHSVAADTATDVDAQLGELRTAIDDGDLEAANEIAATLRDMLAI